jgi:catechol 2,3-dioxygenase-like lactoylglutathione lyase family enzyme
MTAVLTSIAPQFLVDDLARSIEYYCRCLGFELDFNYEGFYASVSRDGCAIHLKAAPKTVADRAHRKQHEHLDAFIALGNVTALHDELRSRGALVTKPLEDSRGRPGTSTSKIRIILCSASRRADSRRSVARCIGRTHGPVIEGRHEFTPSAVR